MGQDHNTNYKARIQESRQLPFAVYGWVAESTRTAPGGPACKRLLHARRTDDDSTVRFESLPSGTVITRVDSAAPSFLHTRHDYFVQLPFDGRR